MMPGETPPAAAAATACAGCGALQQNLNEYVAALIALKPKIIDTHHLLTEYEQKCNELKSAEREINTLRNQVEQMLQKISPLEKCQEELRSVKEELEEKTSSLKIYQETHLEYSRVKEEMDKSDAMKKKLEAKAKKLEEASVKHMQDFKQLKAEKKVLEKELKKAQEKIEASPNVKQKKVLKHAETQSERESPVVNLDKEKIQALLKELWLCIDSSAGQAPNDKRDSILAANFHSRSRTWDKTKAVQNHKAIKPSQRDQPSPCSSPEICATQTSLPSLLSTLDSSPARYGAPMETKGVETSEAYHSNRASYKSRSLEVVMQSDLEASSMELLEKEQDGFGESLQDILKWARPLPPVLSPIPPAASSDTLIGDITESSDEEMDQEAQILENILGKCEQDEQRTETLCKKSSPKSQSKCDSSSVNSAYSELQELPERCLTLTNEESVLGSEALVATLTCPDERDPKSREEENQLEDYEELMETDATLELAICSAANLSEKPVNTTKIKDSVAPDLMSSIVRQGQEETGESKHKQEVTSHSFVNALEKSSDLTKEAKEIAGEAVALVPAQTDDDQLQIYKSSNQQQVEEPILATKNVLIVPEKLKEGSGAMAGEVTLEAGFQDIPTVSTLGKARHLSEACVTAKQATATEGFHTNIKDDPELMEERMFFKKEFTVAEVEYPAEQIQQEPVADHVSDTSFKLQCVEENHSNEKRCSEENEPEVNGVHELVVVGAGTQSIHTAPAADECSAPLGCTDVVVQTGNESICVPSTPSRNGDNNQLKAQNENVVEQDRLFESITKEARSVNVQKEECIQNEQYVGQNECRQLLREKSESVPPLSGRASIGNSCLSQPESPIQTNRVDLDAEIVTGNASEVEQVEDPKPRDEENNKEGNLEPMEREGTLQSAVCSTANPNEKSVNMTKMKSAAAEQNSTIYTSSNCCQSPEVTEKEECVTSGGLGEEMRNAASQSTHLLMAKGGEIATTFETVLAKDVRSCLIPGAGQCEARNEAATQETTTQNSVRNSSEAKAGIMADIGINDIVCSITTEIVLEEKPCGDPVLSLQDVTQAEDSNPETAPSDAQISSPKSTIETKDVTSSNFEVRIELSNKNSQSFADDDVASKVSSAPLCIAPSFLAREDADQVDGEDLKGKETVVSDFESKYNTLGCHVNHNHKNVAEVEQASKQSTTSETQVLVNAKDQGSESNIETLTPSLNSINTEHITVANKTLQNINKELLTSEMLRNPLGNWDVEVEHSLDEDPAKEADEILSDSVKSGEVDDTKVSNTVAVENLSTPDSSEDESYQLRKVNCIKVHQSLPVVQQELSLSPSRIAAPSDKGRTSVAGHELSHVAEEASPKDQLASKHAVTIPADEAVATISEHSYATGWTCLQETSVVIMEAPIAAEISKEKQIEQGISEVDSTSQMLVEKSDFVSKSSSSDLEANGVIEPPDIEYSGVDVKPSEIGLTFYKGKLSTKQERNITVSEWSSDMEPNNVTSYHGEGSSNTHRKKKHHIQNDNKTIAAKNNWHSDTQISQSEQKITSEKSESSVALATYTQNRAKQMFMTSNGLNISAKAGTEAGRDTLFQRTPSHKGKRENMQTPAAETVLANADTSTPTKRSHKMLRKIRQEMGPPLPPLLLPLMATPPRTVQSVSPVMSSSSSQFSLPSPLGDLISPIHGTPLPPLMSPLSDTPKHESPPTFATPSPSETLIGQRTLSSPLQFCSATPKHALPVPGRLPPSATGSTSAVTQENSVRILDSMYPELSARARTLNILKGNVQLSRSSLGGNEIPRLVCQIGDFKAIASTSTAFVKTWPNVKPDSEQPSSSVSRTGKRAPASEAMPRSAKRLRLDSESPKLDFGKEDPLVRTSDADETVRRSDRVADQSPGDYNADIILPAEKGDDPDTIHRAVAVALERLSQSCFDLLPVIRSHQHVGKPSKIPVMRDEEREVVYEFGVTNQHLAEQALLAILAKLKTQKTSLDQNHVQSLCRVYIGICRQLGDLEKARLFCYSLLKEDFPKSGNLILFVGNMWNEVFSSEGVISKAIQLIARQRTRGEEWKYLKAVLNCEESTPVDINVMVSSLLLALQLNPQVEFQQSEQYGEDLRESTWEYVFAIDLLCSHQKWRWTHDHIISKELWPIMDKWTKNRHGSGNISSPSDTIVATVLRLIGCLGQIGLKEGFFSAVGNISSVIRAFLQHAKEKAVPWGVQLATVYALCDLGSSSPPEILEALQAWEAGTTHSLPPAVSSSIAEVHGLVKCSRQTGGCSST